MFGDYLSKTAPILLQDRLSQSLRRLPELEQATIAMSLERVVGLMEDGHLDSSHNLAPGSSFNETTEANESGKTAK